MRVRIISAALLSAVLLSSCASWMPADVRPEVAQQLNEARHLADSWNPGLAIVELDAAATIPNLNSDERYQIQLTRASVLHRLKSEQQGLMPDPY
jgi:hypothetical protein